MTSTLLSADDPLSFTVVRPDGTSPYLLACDHAGRRIPRLLGDLGVSPADRETHIAWDIGVAGVGERLSQALDAFLVLQTYSRLVIDCNRPLTSADSVVTASARVPVPGNVGLSPADVELRRDAIFHPYHEQIRAERIRREQQRRPTVFIALHSFTPNLGDERPFHAGVLYHRDRRIADVLLELLRRESGLVVGDNEPYAASDLTDYSIVEHAERHGAPYVELEIRQDLIADSQGQDEWAQRFARLFRTVSETFHF